MVFSSWRGDIKGNQNPAVITINSSKIITAVFGEVVVPAEEPNETTYSLAINIQGEGSVNINPEQEEYEEGTIMALTASPTNFWEFLEWSGDLSSSQTSIGIIMDSYKDVTALFTGEEEIIESADVFFAANGLTVRYPDATPGEKGILSGVEYEVVDRSLLITLRYEGADLTRLHTTLVTDMSLLFAAAPSFNQNIGGWDTGRVTNMDNMFRDARGFNRDLSAWCVSLITDKPTNFDLNTDSWELPQPVWGTCP